MKVPWIYNLLQSGISKSDTQTWFVREVIQQLPGQRILDIGCGTANVLAYFNQASYVGIDINAEYIEKARTRFDGQGEFHCIDLNDANLASLGKFDLVLLLGVLHHLNDAETAKLMRSIPAVMQPDGVVITIDPTVVARQHLIARVLAKLDRGRFVRSPENYRKLFQNEFVIKTEITKHDLLRVPYSHAIFVAQLPSG